MSNNVGKFFDSKAEIFDSNYSDHSWFSKWFTQTFQKAIFDRFDAAINEAGEISNKNILDIGCGSGVYSLEYTKRGAAKVTGIDFSDEMLAMSEELIEENGFSDKVTFVKGDFSTHQFEEKFDVIIAMGVFDYVAEPGKFLAKMSELSSGKVIASFPGKSPVRMHLRRIRYNLQNCPVFFYTEEQIHELAQKSGLKNYELQFIPHSGTGYILVGDNS